MIKQTVLPFKLENWNYQKAGAGALGNVVVEIYLIIRDLDHIIGSRVDNCLSDFFLAPHGVNGDDGTFQSEGFYQ